MEHTEELDTLIKLVVKRMDFSQGEFPKNTKEIAENRSNRVSDFLIEVLKLFLKQKDKGNKEDLAKYFGLKSMNSLLYDKKITSSHVISSLMLIWDCKTPEEFIEKIVSDAIKKERPESVKKSDAEWAKLDEILDEDEKMYLIYCGQKYDQLKKARSKKRS